ncbi:tRNA guanosine-2'-O-methyltransferase [Meredithblackwellia eburnea MCA 4105]
MKFLLLCAQPMGLEEFRQPELDSIATLFNFHITYQDPKQDIKRPYLIVDLESEREARLLGSRSIAIKTVWEYWYDASTYEDLHQYLKTVPELWEKYAQSPSTTWKFDVGAYGQVISMKEKVDVINSFAYMNFLGDIRMKGPDVEVGVFEEYFQGQSKLEKESRSVHEMRRVWMGRKICDSQRHLVDVFDLKKRAYIGNTSMEAEVSLLMANQALADKGKLVYDPFAGTGSMLLTSSAFGAYTFGSDIDGRQMRGKTKSISHSAEQYGVTGKIIDCASFDMTQHPFRTGEIFDAIITDPPYGVRAGAKRLGRKETRRKVYEPTLIPGRESEGFAHELPDYVPPSFAWEMTDVIDSLVTYALYLLKPGGRLVFFLPTDNAEYADVDVPVVEGLQLISNSCQDFGKWSRRLITMVKVSPASGVLNDLDRGIKRLDIGTRNDAAAEGEEAASKLPGHANFGRKFMQGFV